MKKVQKFITECGVGGGLTCSYSLMSTKKALAASKKAYMQYKQELKASSMFKTDETANAAFINVVRVQIPKVIDMISKLPDKNKQQTLQTFRSFDELLTQITKFEKSLSRLNDEKITEKRNYYTFELLTAQLTILSEYYSITEKLRKLINKIEAFRVEYEHFKMY